MKFFDDILAEQSRMPSGFIGKLSGLFMNRQNRKLIEWTLELLDVKPTDNILDIGFGSGLSIKRASERASQGWSAGIELSETMLRQASKLNAAKIKTGQIELRNGNASSMPYDENKFDKGFAVNVLYFWEDPMSVLREMQRVIKPEGRVAIGFLDEKDLKKIKYTQTGVYKLYNGDKVIELLTEAGFSQARFEENAVHRMGLGICAVAEN